MTMWRLMTAMLVLGHQAIAEQAALSEKVFVRRPLGNGAVKVSVQDATLMPRLKAVNLRVDTLQAQLDAESHPRVAPRPVVRASVPAKTEAQLEAELAAVRRDIARLEDEAKAAQAASEEK